jgi:PAS domain S-box-containing protein
MHKPWRTIAGMRGFQDLLRDLSSSRITLACAAILAYAVWVVSVQSAALTGFVAYVLLVFTRSAAAVAILGSAEQIDPSQAKRAWRFLGTGIALWAMAEAVQTASWAITGAPLGTPGFPDLLRVGGYLALAAAVITYPTRSPERFGRIRELLDMIILSTSVLSLSWMVFIRPVLEVGLAGPISVFWSAIRPVMDLVLLVLLFRLSLLDAPANEIKALRLLGLAVFVMAFSDLWRGYQLLISATRPASLLEAGWMATNVLLIVASRQMRLQAKDVRFPATQPSQRLPRRLEPLLSIASTYAVVGFTAVDWWVTGQVDWFGVGTAVALGLMLVARQGFIVGQREMRQVAALVNASADMAFILQSDGLIHLANPALLQVVGERTDVEEKLNLSHFVITEKNLSQIISLALEDGWRGEVSFKRQDGSTLPVSLSLRPVRDEHQTQTLFAATAHDLTTILEREKALRTALDEVALARNELEALNAELEDKVEARTEELKRIVVDLGRLNEELKELDRLKTEFVALVSHELRAPLTNIRTGVELILESYPNLDPSVEESLGLVHSETHRLAGFVETILNLSALEAGRFPIQPQSLQLEEVAMHTIRRFPEEAGGRRLTLDFSPEIPPVVADGRALESVFYHLLDNALKYAPESEVRLEAWLEGQLVYVAVTDSGPGIPAEEREQVFDLFHRLDSRDSREVYGHGLGLPMVKRLLEAMDGGIRVEQDPEGGARMVFWLPRSDKMGQSA